MNLNIMEVKLISFAAVTEKLNSKIFSQKTNLTRQISLATDLIIF